MKLRTSKLCVNCESIYEGAGPCPDCASEVFFWVYQALGTVLAPQAVLMNEEPGMGRRMPVADLPRLPESGGMYRDLPMYSEAKRSRANMLGRLGEGISRVLTSIAPEDPRPKVKTAYQRRNPLEFGT
jgi:hypothetical protein